MGRVFKKHESYSQKSVLQKGQKFRKRGWRRKTTILLMDSERKNSPLLTQYHRYLPTMPYFNVIHDTRLNIPIQRIINERHAGRIPDYVYWGFGIGNGVQLSHQYINDNNIDVILDIGDINYMIGRNAKNLQNIKVKHLIARWPETKDYSQLKVLQKVVKRRKWLQHANVINVPWAIDHTQYKDNPKKDIDVAFVCTTVGKFHGTRRRIKEILTNMKGVTKKVGTNFNDYYNILSRSKIFVVEGSERDFMTQKYIEGPVHGAMLLGEIPTTAKATLGKSMVGVTDWESELEDKIRYYLEHDDERKELAKAGKHTVINNFNFKKSTESLKQLIKTRRRK